MEVVAIDIGGTKMDLSVVRENGQIISETRQRIEPTPRDPPDALRILADYILRNLGQYSIKAVGIGAPGIIGGENGGYFLPNVSNLPEWGNFNLRGNLESRLNGNISEKKALSMESDVYLATAAELLIRIASSKDMSPNGLFPFFYLTVSTGVGGEQAIIDGSTWKVYRNQHGVTEVGHESFNGIAPNLNPIKCNYMGFDCVETYLGGNHMLERYGLLPEDATPEMMAMVAENLGKFLSQNELTRNSKIIIVGGKIANEWNKKYPFLDEVKNSMLVLFNQNGIPAPSLEVSILGDDAGIVGGWAIAMKQLTGIWPKYQISLIPSGSYAKISQLSPATP